MAKCRRELTSSTVAGRVSSHTERRRRYQTAGDFNLDKCRSCLLSEGGPTVRSKGGSPEPWHVNSFHDELCRETWRQDSLLGADVVTLYNASPTIKSAKRSAIVGKHGFQQPCQWLLCRASFIKSRKCREDSKIGHHNNADERQEAV